MQKRGLSTIVVTLIIILVSLVAVGIIWVVVKNVIQTGSEGVGLGQFSLSAKIKDVSIDNSSNNVSLTVRRNAGKGDLIGINFVFSSGTDTEVIMRDVSLNELEERKFNLHLSNISVSDLISVSIVPLIKQNEEETLGIILDKYNLKGSSGTSSGGTSCTPTNCTTLGYLCGNWNDGCGGNLNCGTCSGGQVCNSSGKCVSSCTPTNCTTLGYECGSWSDGCGGNLDCGNCTGGQVCNSSGRCVVQTPVTGNFRYVRQGATGTNNGSDWNNAWESFADIVWNSIQPGDTIYIAGGNYQDLDIRGNGTSTERIYIKRARLSDVGCTSAPGWQNVFDSQVIINNADTATITFTSGNGNYVTIDGQIEQGIKVNFGDDERGIQFLGGTNHAELKYLEIAGPGSPEGYDYPDGDNTRCIQATTGSAQFLLISHCDLHGAGTLIILANAFSPIIEYSNLHDTGTAGDTIIHPNILFVQGSNNGIFRYNNIYNHATEGLFFAYGGQSGWKIHGNIFRDAFPNSYGRGIETEPGYSHGSHYIYNNIFVNVWLGIRLAGTQTTGEIYNNIFWNNLGNDFSSYSHDYNYYDTSTAEPHGINGGNPFIDLGNKNFHINSTSLARNGGVELPDQEYRFDRDTHVYGADGFWDIGAYEYVG